MKRHKWKFHSDVNMDICIKCAIGKQNGWYIDLTADPYFIDRASLKRPECKEQEEQPWSTKASDYVKKFKEEKK